MPGVVCPDPPAQTPITSPTMAATTLPPPSTAEVPWPSSAPDTTVSPWPDSESGIEDSAESVEGGSMPLSPPIPIPSPRRSSLQTSHTQVSPSTQDDKSSSAPATAHESDTAPQPRTSTPKPPAASEDGCQPADEAVEEEGCEVPTIHISEVRQQPSRWSSSGGEDCPVDGVVDGIMTYAHLTLVIPFTSSFLSL